MRVRRRDRKGKEVCTNGPRCLQRRGGCVGRMGGWSAGGGWRTAPVVGHWALHTGAPPGGALHGRALQGAQGRGRALQGAQGRCMCRYGSGGEVSALGEAWDCRHLCEGGQGGTRRWTECRGTSQAQ